MLEQVIREIRFMFLFEMVAADKDLNISSHILLHTSHKSSMHK
jgi:hypothetical protein